MQENLQKMAESRYISIYIQFVLRASVPFVCAVVDSTAGPVLAARPRNAAQWWLTGVVEICRPVNNPPVRLTLA